MSPDTESDSGEIFFISLGEIGKAIEGACPALTVIGGALLPTVKETLSNY